jgi:CubicO group peptidase (beta-lactamase class C family)
MPLLRHALLLPLSITGVLADFLGPTYPAPVDLTSSKSLVPPAWKNLTSIFDAYLKEQQKPTATSSLTIVENVTFSIGLFSLHDSAAQRLQYHYTAPEIANAPNGTHKVDGDSIYRVASVSKLFTVFAGMLSLTDEDWNRPLSEIIPGLADFAGREDRSPYDAIRWDKITPWALAAQMAGLPSLPYSFADLLLLGPSVAGLYGLPPADVTSFGPCWSTSLGSCNADEYVENARFYQPGFLPWTTPAYSNDGFMMLGIAISNITGKSMQTIYRESIFEPLGLTSSHSAPPTGEAERARSVVTSAEFDLDGGFSTPSGGIFSTTNDLTKFGLAILNSTFIPSDKTRKWMKPISHTASLTYSVGAPWEIIRYVHPSTGKVTDLYTKLGSSGSYGGIVVLIPDYGAGFSALNTYSNFSIRNTAFNTVLDYVTNAILPALEAQAAAEAASKFVGTYFSTDSTLNSSLTIAFNESTVVGASSGLSITGWVSNGTDVLASDLFGGIKPRLLLSIPNQSPDGAAGKVAFQASTAPQTSSYFAAGATELGTEGPFTGQVATNLDWMIMGSTHYARLGLNRFVFDVNAEGCAMSVRPGATNATLTRRG